MLNNYKIGTKVILLVLFLTLIAIVTETVISHMRNKDILKKDSFEKLSSISKAYEHRLENYFSSIEAQIKVVHKTKDFQVSFDSLYYYSEDSGIDMSQELVLKKDFWNDLMKNDVFKVLKEENEFQDVIILNGRNNKIFEYSSSIASKGDVRFRTNMENQTVNIHKREFYVNQPIYEKEKFFVDVSYPVKTTNGEEGLIICKVNLEKILKSVDLNDLVPETSSFAVNVFKSEKREVFKVGQYKRQSDFSGKVIVENPSPVLEEWISDYSPEDSYLDEYNETLAYLHFNKRLSLGLETTVNHSEVFKELPTHFRVTALIGVFILCLAFFLSVIFTRFLTFPMLKLKKVLGLMSNGVLPKELHSPLKDEVGEMITIVNKIVSSLKKTAAFAHKIGEGEFDTAYKPLSNKDILGHALVNMRESLQNADKKDALRNWIVTGVAEIGEILRSNDTLIELGDEILDYLCKRINAVQGAFYTVEGEEDAHFSDLSLDMKASFAYGKKKYLKGTYRFSEGLVGQSAVERDIILRTEISDDYTAITSGLLGEQKPKCLLVVPLITNEKVYGVIELAGFKKFTPGEVQFMEEVSLIIARTIFNINVNDRTRRLLQESQRMSSELRVHQAELQENAVEMEKTQEELQESNQKLEIQIRNVNNAQKRMHTLLENASEVITIYEEDGTIRYISPSVERILGYSQDEMVGINDIKYVDEKEQELVRNMLEQLKTSGSNEQVTIQMSYYRKTGDKIWLEANGKNKLNDPAIKGIVVNSRDITERLRAEREERKSGQMQALSENSPDLITRVSNSGTFFYINPIIEKLTGNGPDYFMNKKLNEIELNDQIKESWSEIVEKVLTDGEKYAVEMDFPSELGQRIMSVNAIPETDADTEEIESVLVVSHDITEQKQIENEILLKNKKINDSINYAERIQEAILPDSVIMDQTFDKSFIYYKPRDVVSGDFPWFMKKGDDIYLGAVDCTGHGVPGALISIVGFFLLNDIVGSRGFSTPGEILDNLDKLVTSTFKQDQESSKIKDGMDIAFCKINLKKGEVEYSGAHRPLYITRATGEFEEIKGSKFPIGGGSAYSNKTNFENHLIKMNEGDSIYFFSDGFPDQFGGPQNRKFGPKRIKQLLEDTKTSELSVVRDSFDKQFMEWKGEGKQTDDVLLIGIRF